MSRPRAHPIGARCPTCGKGVFAHTASMNPFRPFCSRRCQLIDLGKWFNEEYVISSPLTDVPDGLIPPDGEPAD